MSNVEMTNIEMKVTTYIAALTSALHLSLSDLNNKYTMNSIADMIVSAEATLTKAFLDAEAAVVNAKEVAINEEQAKADASPPLMSGTNESDGS